MSSTRVIAPLLLVAAGIVSTLATAPACVSALSIDDRPCPCLAGWTCCPEENRCVEHADECASDEDDDDVDTVQPETPAPSPGRMKLARTSPRCLTQDAEHLFWVDAEGRLAGVRKTGGEVASSRFALPPQVVVECDLVVEGGFVYATMYGLGAIARVSVAKSGEDLVIGEHGSLLGTFLTPSTLVLDETSIYVAERDSGAIKRIPKDVVPDAGTAGPDAGAVTVLGHGGTSPHHLVADADSLYWLDDGGLRKMSKQGGNIVTMWPDKGSNIVLDRGQLYWVSGGLRTISLAGGVPSQVELDAPASAASGTPLDPGSPSSFRFVASDRHQLFMTTETQVFSAPMSGGSLSLLFTHSPSSTPLRAVRFTLLVDEGHVFWNDEQTIWSWER